MSDIKFGKYYNIESAMHNMNPLFKLISLIIYCILLFIIEDVSLIIVMALLLMILISFSNINYIYYFKSLKLILPLIIFIIIINTIFNVSFVYTSISILKLILLILYSSMISFSTSLKDINNSLNKLLYPLCVFGINTSKVSFSLSLSIRFIPIIFEQGSKIMKSQASRGLDFKNGNLVEKIKSIKSIIFPMFLLSFKRSDDLADFMEIRLYKFEAVKSKTKIKDLDVLYMLSHIMLIILFIFKYIVWFKSLCYNFRGDIYG